VLLDRGPRAWGATPRAGDPKHRRPADAAAGRLLSGAIGLGNTLGASLSQNRSLGTPDSAVLLGGGLLLLLTGLLAILTPRLIAYPIGVAALWFAAGLLLHAWKLRRANGDAGEP
jgi:cardiolipin synthase